MKIAVASLDGIRITEHAGRCRRFYIFTAAKDSPLECSSRILNEEQTFHHLKPGDENPLEGCEVLIAGSMGPKLVNKLRGMGIEAAICQGGKPEEAARDWLQGQLKPLDKQAPCSHNHHT